MKFIFFLILLSLELFSYESSTVDCNQIFEQRKSEIKEELLLLEDKKQSIKALKEANEEILAKKEQKLNKLNKSLQAQKEEVLKIKKETLEIYEKNQKLLKEISDTKNSKIAKAYLKMKDSKAGAILDQMNSKKVAIILSHLTPKKIATIMAKMDPINASKVTKILSSKMNIDLNSTK